MDDINIRIAHRIRELRLARGYTLDVLAARCQVSRSAISLIERGETSPTAVVLEKLANGLEVPLTQIFTNEAGNSSSQPLIRRNEQAEWRDPETGYIRRTVSPPNLKLPFQIVEIQLGETSYALGQGDCLAMQLDQPVIYSNHSAQVARYILVVSNQLVPALKESL